MPNKYSEKDSQAYIQVDKKCISCSDNPKKLIQLFKLACLTYFPGKVWFRGESLKRTDLIGRLNEHTSELEIHLAETIRKANNLQKLINKQRP